MNVQLKHHSTVSQFGQLNGALSLDGKAAREHFKDILHNQVRYKLSPSGSLHVNRAGLEWEILQGVH